VDHDGGLNFVSGEAEVSNVADSLFEVVLVFRFFDVVPGTEDSDNLIFHVIDHLLWRFTATGSAWVHCDHEFVKSARAAKLSGEL